MKNMHLIIGICIGFVVVLLTGVILFEGYQRTQAASKKMMQQGEYQVPAYKNDVKNPVTTSLGEQKGSETQSLLDELSKTVDDEGAKDLQSISSEASSL